MTSTDKLFRFGVPLDNGNVKVSPKFTAEQARNNVHWLVKSTAGFALSMENGNTLLTVTCEPESGATAVVKDLRSIDMDGNYSELDLPEGMECACEVVDYMLSLRSNGDVN